MLILGYLVPALVRRRQAVAMSRVDDRFSRDLRVVARGGSSSDRRQAARLPSTTALVAAPMIIGPRGEELTVNRPPGMADRRTANEARRVAAVRAALAARRAEQAAAARRRLVLTLALVVVSGIAWAAVAFAQFSVLLAAFPTVVLVGVLWLGVRAAQAERAEWSQVPTSLTEPRSVSVGGPTYSPAQLRAHLAATGAAPAAPSSATTAAADGDQAGRLSWSTGEIPVEAPAEPQAPAQPDVDVDSPVLAEQQEAREVAAVADVPGSWTPVPVPVPTYTLKPMAVRRETAPYSAEDEAAASPTEVSLDVTLEDGIDLRAVLARRRAVGA